MLKLHGLSLKKIPSLGRLWDIPSIRLALCAVGTSTPRTILHIAIHHFSARAAIYTCVILIVGINKAAESLHASSSSSKLQKIAKYVAVAK
jgi:hypothetical protein